MQSVLGPLKIKLPVAIERVSPASLGATLARGSVEARREARVLILTF